MRAIALFLLLASLCTSSYARSPYAGQAGRPIKALSPDEVQGYLSGAGMGYALAAELNHHPGPRHVLDLSKELALTGEQHRRTEALFQSMKARASALGASLVDKERALDALFASGAVSREALQALVIEAAAIEARIRHVHLSAHVEQRRILTAEQVARYDRLRGYTDGGAGQNDHGRGHGHQGHMPKE